MANEKQLNQTSPATPDAAAAKSPDVAEKSSKRMAFQVMEAYKMIRTNLMFALANKDSNAVIVSSAEPSAGKSTLSANLAIVMAQTGARVLLIDADMRKPTQHRNFQLSRTMGLSKILGGLATVEECLHKDAKPNVDVILSGPTPPNPSELLGSARMKNLLDEMNEKYDYIFIDMPPLCVVADALVAAPMAAGVVLVARHNQTMYEEFAEALEKVESAGGALLGVVLSDMHSSVGSYGRYGYGRYGYGRYGYNRYGYGRYGYGRYGRYGRYGGYRYYQRYDYEYGNNSGKK